VTERAPLVPEATALDYLVPFLYRRKIRRWEHEMAAWRKRCRDQAVADFDALCGSLAMFRER
jgi:hypothetical protein